MADYTTLAQMKIILGITSTDTNDDAAIEQFIDAATVYIDGATNRTFVSASATRYYDVPDGPELYVDDFTALTSVTNGDGTAIPTTEFILLPANITPKYALRIKAVSSYYWAESSTTGNREQAIAVVANWGYSAACPADIRSACEAIVTSMYKSRRGEGAEGVATITGAGVVITPKDVPQYAQKVINRYARIL